MSPGIPKSIDDYTPEWFTAALSETHPGVRVTAVDVEAPDQGTSTRLRAAVTYADGTSEGLPTRLFIKSIFENEFKDLFTLAGIYRAETRFYAEIKPEVAVDTPAALYTDYDESDDTFVIVLEDLVRARWGHPDQPVSVKTAAAVLEQMAVYHGRFWGPEALAPFDWLQDPVSGPMAGAIELFSDNAIAQLVTGSVSGEVPTSMRDEERLDGAIKAIMGFNAANRITLLHGDPHLKNFAFISDTEPVFADWQVLRKANWAHDVSYFLGTSISVADRRAHERELLRGYLNALVAHDGPRLDEDTAWLDYRAQPLYGLMMWLATPPEMQPADTVAAYTERLLAAAADLDTMAAIDELTGGSG